MGLDIWFAEDIRNALLAANEASAQTAAVIIEVGMVSEDAADLLAMGLRAYRGGYKAALCTVALAFGIAPQGVITGSLPVASPLAPVETKKEAPR